MLIDDCKRVMATPYDLSSCYQVGEQSDQQNAILDVFSSEIKNEIGASFPSLYYTLQERDLPPFRQSLSSGNLFCYLSVIMRLRNRTLHTAEELNKQLK